MQTQQGREIERKRGMETVKEKTEERGVDQRGEGSKEKAAEASLLNAYINMVIHVVVFAH